MALTIAEFRRSHRDQSGGVVQIAEMPPITVQSVSITASSVKSAALNAGTTFIRVYADVACSIAIGPDATVDAADATQAIPISATTAEYFGVAAGDKVAVKS